MSRYANLDEILELFGTCSDEDMDARLNIQDAISEKIIELVELPKWIPCSERLPKKYKQVLCCNKDGRVFSSALTYVHPEYIYYYFGKHRSVIAWMPLPKPWKGADDEMS